MIINDDTMTPSKLSEGRSAGGLLGPGTAFLEKYSHGNSILRTLKSQHYQILISLLTPCLHLVVLAVLITMIAGHAPEYTGDADSSCSPYIAQYATSPQAGVCPANVALHECTS